MSLRRLAALLVVMCICSATVTVLILRSPARQANGPASQARTSPLEAQANEGVRPFAYITQRELVVMRGNQTLVRIPRFFEESDPAQNKVVWANSGDYVALLKNVMLLQEDPSAEELIVINIHTGGVRHITCPQCYDLTPIGKNSILASSYPAGNSAEPNFLEFNLDTGRPGTRVRLNVPTTGTGVLFSLASTQKYVLTNQQTLGGDAQLLELTKVNGKIQTSLGYFNSNEYMLAAMSENANDTSDTIAVAFRPNPGECVAQFPVVLFNSSGGLLNTNMSKAEPPGHAAGVDEGLQVNDLWWGADGHFHATIASWTCDNSKRSENDKQVLANSSTMWKLDGRTWVREGLSPATMARQLEKNVWVTLVIPDCIGPVTGFDTVRYCDTGTLYLDRDGNRTLVARGVISISAPSPSYLPHTPQNALPTLGQQSGYFVGGKGFGQVRPSEIYNGGDPTGLVTHVTWKSWGGTHAVGTGNAEYIGPNQSVSTGSQETAVIVAFNLGPCNGQLSYQAVEWYFPQHGQAFNPHQYEDVCTGTYVGGQ